METLNPRDIIETQQAIRTLERCFNEVDLESIKSQIDNSVKQLEGKIKEIVPILQLTLEYGSFKVIFGRVMKDGKECIIYSSFELDNFDEFVTKVRSVNEYDEKFIEAYLNLLKFHE